MNARADPYRKSSRMECQVGWITSLLTFDAFLYRTVERGTDAVGEAR